MIYSNSIRNRLPIWLMMVFVFFMPIWPKLLPPLIILWVLSCFFVKPFTFPVKPLFQSKGALAVLLFFALHVACLLYTDNMKSGVFDVETKLSLLIYPIFMTNSFQLIKPKINWILWSFILGLLVASMSCLVHSFYLFFKYDAPFQYFTYTDLSIFLHPAYFAMYLCFAIVLLVAFLASATTIMRKSSIAALLLFFCVMIYLLSSKSGLVSLGVVLIATMFFFMRKEIKFYLLIAGMLIGFGVVLMTNSRFTHFQQAVVNEFSGNESAAANIDKRDNERLVIWQTSVSILKEKWLTGVGAGDVKYVLNENYPSSFEAGIEKQFNAHNQFLETWLATGLLGFLLLIYMVVRTFALGWRNGNFTAIGFSMIILINFMVESVLNSQAGILFFAFFYMLIILRNECHQKITNNHNSIIL